LHPSVLVETAVFAFVVDPLVEVTVLLGFFFFGFFCLLSVANEALH